MSELERLGWNDFFRQQLAEISPPPLVSRVVEEQRGAFRLAGQFDGWAEVSGRFRHEARRAADFPAVGDWVCVSARPGGRALITRRLTRRSTISRKTAGRVVREQVMAVNVDTIFLVTAVGYDLNARRIERYLAVVREAGATPVVVLNKIDLSGDPIAEADAVRARLPFVDVVAVSATTADGMDRLDAYLAPAQTIALIGSSGVGKSTLVNRLTGREVLRTGAIRERDGKGRHTTSSRHLVELPGGALLIDTPGMRELQPWVAGREAAPGLGAPQVKRPERGEGPPRLINETFEDIAALAWECRFTDCAHASEPGCAVLAAVERGAVDADRLEHFRQLGREAAFEERRRDKSASAAEKRRSKQIHQAQKNLYRDRDRS